MITQAMLFAAGRGTRLGVLTETMPKPLVSVAGEKPLLRTLSLLEKAGVKKVVMNVSYLGHMIKGAVNAWQKETLSSLDILFSEEQERLETGGGLTKALSLLDKNQPCFILNSDIVWSEDLISLLGDLAESYENQPFLLGLSSTQYARDFLQGTQGDFFENNGQLSFLNKQLDTQAPYTYSAVGVVNLQEFSKHTFGEHFSLVKVWRQLETENRLYGFIHDAKWVDMGSPVGLEKAEEMLLSRKGG